MEVQERGGHGDFKAVACAPSPSFLRVCPFLPGTLTPPSLLPSQQLLSLPGRSWPLGGLRNGTRSCRAKQGTCLESYPVGLGPVLANSCDDQPSQPRRPAALALPAVVDSLWVGWWW